jgi:hypothetical protein
MRHLDTAAPPQFKAVLLDRRTGCVMRYHPLSDTSGSNAWEKPLAEIHKFIGLAFVGSGHGNLDSDLTQPCGEVIPCSLLGHHSVHEGSTRGQRLLELIRYAFRLRTIRVVGHRDDGSPAKK